MKMVDTGWKASVQNSEVLNVIITTILASKLDWTRRAPDGDQAFHVQCISHYSSFSTTGLGFGAGHSCSSRFWSMFLQGYGVAEVRTSFTFQHLPFSWQCVLRYWEQIYPGRWQIDTVLGGPTASKASCEANQMKRIIEYDTYNRRICAPLLYFMFLIVERIKD